MNKYRANGLSPTLPSVVAASIFLAGLSVGSVQASEKIAEKNMSSSSSYYSDGLSHAQAAQALQISPGVDSSKFLEAVSSFYSQLLSDQKAMDPEIAALLSENLWDLYAD